MPNFTVGGPPFVMPFLYRRMKNAPSAINVVRHQNPVLQLHESVGDD